MTLAGVPLAAGTVLAKKYRIGDLIGEGGTGVVCEAWHLQLEQKVAIKFLRTALANEEVRLRFEREARAISQIESDHVVLVLDFGATEDGALYMVMEHLEGKDLARHLKEDGPLAVQDAVDCMLQVCAALERAHAAGVVHRDLKPGNLFLTRRPDGAPHVKVVDFGISKIRGTKILAGGPNDSVTSEFTVLGSPRYMAPEQLRNAKDVDARADLWSVGAVFYQLVSGKRPFDGETNVEASLKVLSADPVPLGRLVPGLSPKLEAVVVKCLAKDRASRWQTAAELSRALLPFASERGREAIQRLATAREAPSLEIAVAVSPESSAKLAAAPPPTTPRSSVPAPLGTPIEIDPKGRLVVPSRVAIGLGALAAVVLAFAVMVLAKTIAESLGVVRPAGSEVPSAAAVARPPGLAREPAVVPLDAGWR